MPQSGKFSPVVEGNGPVMTGAAAANPAIEAIVIERKLVCDRFLAGPTIFPPTIVGNI
jgi:hypothetical protein